ncbi:AAA family ATPase [Halomonas beimenensis]|uniref:AAA family ATPase n=1 Tax=Halomonas beimenensis TaxID=475662 RepID=UPI0036156561
MNADVSASRERMEVLRELLQSSRSVTQSRRKRPLICTKPISDAGSTVRIDAQHPLFLRAPSHADALELLLVALKEREGFIKITGEVGHGKTLLCRLLLNNLDGKASTAYIPNPHLPPKPSTRQ